MSDHEQSAIAPGWYATADGAHMRYHDGAQWTDHTQPATPPAPPAAPPVVKAAPVKFVVLWIPISVVMGVLGILGRLANDEPGPNGDSAYNAGYFVGSIVGAFLLGALVAWPVWWLINRNR